MKQRAHFIVDADICLYTQSLEERAPNQLTTGLAMRQFCMLLLSFDIFPSKT